MSVIRIQNNEKKMTNSLEVDILIAKKYLKSEFMNINDEWLTGCVEFFQNQKGIRPYSTKELQEMVKEQWMLADLRDICPGSLPPSLCSQVKATLPGIYVLQMNHLHDVSEPAYQQLQALKKIDITNIEATNHEKEPVTKRMFKLNLTDGIQEINAIEYKTMRNLRNDITPGTKIKIKGPVVCRRGVLMLEEKHLSLIGGEVEDLVISNSYRNIIASKLNLQGNDEVLGQESITTDFPTLSSNPKILSTSAVTQGHIGPISTDVIELSDTDDQVLPEQLVDEMFIDEFDIEQLDAMEKQATITKIIPPNDCKSPLQNTAKKIKLSPLHCHKQLTDNMLMNNADDYPSTSNEFHQIVRKSQQSEEAFDDDDFADHFVEPDLNMANNLIWDKTSMKMSPNTNNQQIGDRIINNRFNQIVGACHNYTTATSGGNFTEGLAKTNTVPQNVNLSNKLKSPDYPTCSYNEQLEKYDNYDEINFTDNFCKPKVTENSTMKKNSNFVTKPIKVSHEPFIYIKQLLEMSEASRVGMTFVVKAQIASLLGKLTLQRDKWELRCKLMDGSGLLDVEVSSTVLTQIIGQSPEEVNSMKAKIQHDNKLKENLVQILLNAQQKLMSLDCLLYVKFMSTGPVITKTEKLSALQIIQLKRRVSAATSP